MSHDPAFDTSIPVLTEVVADQAASVTASAPPAPEPAAPVVKNAPADTPDVLERRAAERWTGDQWAVMERRLAERVLQQLQGRVDFVLEQRLRDGIADAVEKAMKGFSDEIREGLHDTLGQVVSRAVSQEIAHLKTLGK